jgi:large subunit ribosomal protein L31
VREGIHPDYVEAKVTCSCGETFMTRATVPELHIELCSKCHPFYTGKQKFVDTGGRVQRFSDKFGSAASAVLEKEAADKEARQKIADAAADEARKVRESKEAERAERVRVFEAKAARKAEKTANAAEEAPAEEPAVEAEAATEEPPAEETAE